MRFFPLLFIGFFAACEDETSTEKDGEVDEEEAADTASGDFDEDTAEPYDTAQPCEAMLIETDPASEITGWYYRDPFTLTFSEDGRAVSVSITGGDGSEGADVEWSEGYLQATVTPTGLVGDTTYALSVDLCDVVNDIEFTTSEYGTPLEIEAAALLGNTYLFHFGTATINKPAGFGTFLGAYLNAPVLMQIIDVTEDIIDFRGAQGVLSADGTYYYQDSSLASWEFPDSPFDTQPYVSVDAEDVAILYGDYEIGLETIHVEGTFASDGSKMGEGLVGAMVVTSNLAALAGLEGESAICDIVKAMGSECEECKDGSPYCLFLEAEFLDAVLLEDTDLDLIKG